MSKVSNHDHAQDLHHAMLDLLERCAVSTGVVQVDAWEAAGCPAITSIDESTGLKPMRDVVERRLSLEERMQSNNWAFASTPGGCESLEASHSAAEALYLWGDLAKLSIDNRRAWVEYFNQYQDEETGYYLGPYVRERDHISWTLTNTGMEHPWEHMHDHLISCLCPTISMLGGRPRYKLSRGSMTGRFLDRDYLEHYLVGRSWTGYQNDLDFRNHNPWYMGNEYWYPGAILWQIYTSEAGTPEATKARQLLDEVWYRWHDENMSAWGLWYGDKNAESQLQYREGLSKDQPIPNDDPLNEQSPWRWHGMQVMGGAHQLWLYDFENRPIEPERRKKQTDLLLAMQNQNDGQFGVNSPWSESSDSSNCTDVDCLSLLSYNFRRQNHRRGEIQKACERAAIAIVENKIDRHGVLVSRQGKAWSHHYGSYETFCGADAPNVHDQSFYLWALLAAVSVLDSSDHPVVQSLIDRSFPTMPSHWLWVPGRQQYLVAEDANVLGAE